MAETKIKVIHDIGIIPHNDFVLVKVDRDEDMEVKGGIIIPTMAIQNKKTQTGTVAAVGPGKIVNGEVQEMKCKVGDRIIFACFIGYPMVLGEKGEHVVIKDYDAMGVYNEVAEWISEEDFEGVVDSQRKVM